MSDDVARARESFGRRAWGQAFQELTTAEHRGGLDVGDVERLATCAYLIGRADESAAGWERAHRMHEGRDETVDAARCAFWVSFVLLNRGELARGSGWVHRGQRMLDSSGIDCVELGLLGYVESLRRVVEGDVDGAAAGFETAAAIGDRFRNAELVALARVGRGRCLIKRGEVQAGMALLDEAMSMVSAADVSPTIMGDLYCTVIEGCHDVLDVRRAREWTDAFARWCGAQPEIVVYHGQCLVHRAELLFFGGSWALAAAEACRACDALSEPRVHPALGSAHYIRAELHRVRGEFAEAEAAYRRANACGREPQPGLALLWLAKGQVELAVAEIREAIAGTDDDPGVRASRLAPLVEISLAASDIVAARRAADELTKFTAPNMPVLSAMAAHANGSVLIAEGKPGSAGTVLRQAWTAWTVLGAPYEAARVRVLIGRAQRALGNHHGGVLELDAAASELKRLGAWTAALPDIRRTDSSAGGLGQGMTSREVEVLQLLATGATNKEISVGLFISEKTVATHVSSILRKLGVRSRSAATAYAHEKHLL
jgi:DNA-binding CsgD family transcriptional regulator